MMPCKQVEFIHVHLLSGRWVCLFIGTASFYWSGMAYLLQVIYT